jgi:hypothetical protein
MPPDETPEPTPTARETRERRRAQALRDNLRRRKGVKTPTPPTENED